MPNALPAPAGLDNAALLAQAVDLARRRRQATVAIVAHIAEIDARDLHLRQGYTSLYVYCRQALSLSEHEAYTLVAAARVAQRLPAVLELLADGSINLTTIKLLAPVLTFENHLSVLESARGKKRAEVEQLVATLVPQPDVPPMTLRLLSPGAVPLSSDRYRLQLTVDAGTVEKLRLAKDLLRHALPSGDDAAVLERAVSALLADLARKKFAVVDQPRAARETSPGSRHVPAEIKREVFLRDLGRCAFVGTHGRRCAERGFVEFHHVRPYALGGEATVDNIELRCRRHNDYEAHAYFERDRP